ncbi:MAG TPA: hypothetical protein VME45_01790 [Stellaceae bacterium]|nr:hypothetical protein [Stellaceae bacterium]
MNALLTVLGASLAVLVLCGLLLHTPGAGSVDSIGLVRRFVAVLAVAAVLFPWHEFFFWPSLVYAPAVVLFLVDEVTVVGRRFPRAPRERIFP